MKADEKQPTMPDLGTEQAVHEVAIAVKADILRAVELYRQAGEIVTYVEQHTAPWLEITPGLLKAKLGETTLIIEVLSKEADEIEGRMKRNSKPLPEVQVHKGATP